MKRPGDEMTATSTGWAAASVWGAGVAILFVLAVAAAGPPAHAPAAAPRAEAILRDMAVLGDDAMEGRAVGTPGGERAADYLEARLAELGLVPLGPDGSYRQPVPLHGSLPLASSRLTLAGPEGDGVLELWDDYVLFDGGAQTFVPQPIPLVFAGYGIVAPEYDYNDYQRSDPSGRIAVFLAGEPPSNDPAFFDGAEPTVYADPEMKFRIARSRGARGAILLPSPREGLFVDWEEALSLFQSEDVELPYGITGSLNVVLRLGLAESLFAGAETSYAGVLEMDAAGGLGSFPLATRVAFAGVFEERDFTADNLAAELPGSDPALADRYVLVSAHYDHLGVGRPVDGDSIYNGVIDNASGTATALELARVLAARRPGPRRSVVFLLLTGEEKGLVGSRYYCDNPLVPLRHTAAVVNVDGVSFLDTTESFVGVGAGLSSLGERLGEVLGARGLGRSEVPELFRSRQPFFRSDQIAFAQAGVPSILVMEGLDFTHLGEVEGLRRFIAWGRERYHTPFDDLEQPIDSAALRQHAEVLLAFVESLADAAEEPHWYTGSPYLAARLRSLAEGR